MKVCTRQRKVNLSPAAFEPTTKRIQVQFQLGYSFTSPRMAVVNLAVRGSCPIDMHFSAFPYIANALLGRLNLVDELYLSHSATFPRAKGPPISKGEPSEALTTTDTQP